MEERIFTTEVAGRKLTIETGKYAQQAGGSCIVRCGDTAVLVTATASAKPREGIDFFPLSCEFEEKMYAVGKIPGGFIKREGRPTEKAVLTSRLIDRPLRPLFPKNYRNDVQVIATVLSVDQDIPPAVYAMIGSSVALSISDIPFAGPTAAVVVGMVDGEYILNPTLEQMEASRLNLTVAGTKDAVMMVEAGAKELSEDEMLEAILFAHEEIKRICAFISDIQAEIGEEKQVIAPEEHDEDFDAKVTETVKERVEWSLDTFDRYERETRQEQIKQEAFEAFGEEDPEKIKRIDAIIYDLTKQVVRRKITQQGVRPDGRKTTEVRPIWSEVGILKRPHGSGVFTRGQTQVMTILTLGSMSEVQSLDGLSPEHCKRYMHQYNMPPYSVGETRMMRGPGRREIGHGALAERALEPMIPDEETFPYALRLVSEVISSNGSTSMASVCASTLALMDGGVPIKKPVAGVAMGLIKDTENDSVTILTDIQGLEDFLGDMDFKVAGTKDGITAIQMDIKIKGIDREILTRALAQAKEGRMYILGKMMETIDQPREHLSEYAPKIVCFTINPEKIGEVVGPRGKTINKIIAETGVTIDIEDDGKVYICTPDQEAADQARKMIEGIVKEIEVGEVYLGKVVRIMPFGAFVELLPGKDGMVHISKLARERVEKVEDVVNIGDDILVKVIEIDDKGRINLTRKDLLPPEPKKEKKEK
ncbi:MAG: polyribonucleotide nucleotidyltransferase [Clostridiales bacterium]|nr:polyribonucleotide nucleotidyltransferase [Clostridiales bacterium]